MPSRKYLFLLINKQMNVQQLLKQAKQIKALLIQARSETFNHGERYGNIDNDLKGHDADYEIINETAKYLERLRTDPDTVKSLEYKTIADPSSEYKFSASAVKVFGHIFLVTVCRTHWLMKPRLFLNQWR